MPACAVFVPVFSAPIPHAEAGGHIIVGHPHRRFRPDRDTGRQPESLAQGLVGMDDAADFFSARAGNASVSALY